MPSTPISSSHCKSRLAVSSRDDPKAALDAGIPSDADPITVFKLNQLQRIVPLMLMGIGSLPILFVGVLLGSMFFNSPLFGHPTRLFEPAGVDAPDNWAIAFTRMIRWCMALGIAGIFAMTLGLWMLSHRPK